MRFDYTAVFFVLGKCCIALSFLDTPRHDLWSCHPAPRASLGSRDAIATIQLIQKDEDGISES